MMNMLFPRIGTPSKLKQTLFSFQLLANRDPRQDIVQLDNLKSTVGCGPGFKTILPAHKEVRKYFP